MSEPSRQCAYMAAAYPTLTAEDTCEDFHRHEPRVFALAKALAQVFQLEPISDEKVAWFLHDADAIVDDFGGPEWDGGWTVTDIYDAPLPRGLATRFTVNDVEYVLPESEWEPSVPVKRETWDSWREESSPLPLHRTAANVGVVCSTCDGGGCPDCTDCTDCTDPA